MQTTNTSRPPTPAITPWTLEVAACVPRTEAEGPGSRFALWVQGCPLRCPGCCNPEMLEFRTADTRTVEHVLAEILATDGIEGVTFLGGEPTAHAAPLGRLAEGVRATGLSVMVFSGFTLEELRGRRDRDLNRLLDATDLLVDGPYLRERRVTNLRWIGSDNQRIHFLSERYRHLASEAAGWDRRPNTIELRWADGQLSVNGFPDTGLRGWERSLSQADARASQDSPRRSAGDVVADESQRTDMAAGPEEQEC